LRADQAEFQRRATVRAMPLQQAHGTAALAKCDQFLAEDLHCQWQVLQLIRVANRLPEAAQGPAPRGIWPDMRGFAVFGRNVPMMVGAVPVLQERGSRGHRTPPLQRKVLVQHPAELNAEYSASTTSEPPAAPAYPPAAPDTTPRAEARPLSKSDTSPP